MWYTQACGCVEQLHLTNTTPIGQPPFGSYHSTSTIHVSILVPIIGDTMRRHQQIILNINSYNHHIQHQLNNNSYNHHIQHNSYINITSYHHHIHHQMWNISSYCSDSCHILQLVHMLTSLIMQHSSNFLYYVPLVHQMPMEARMVLKER